MRWLMCSRRGMTTTAALLGALVTVSAATVPAAPISEPSFGRLPLHFIENRGQAETQVGFYVQGSDKALYFTAEGVTFALTGSSQPDKRWAVKLDFVGAGSVTPRGAAPRPGVVSYFYGTEKEWFTGLPTFGEVVYESLWPGIDLRYFGTVDQLKHEFAVAPGANPRNIRLRYRGVSSLVVDEHGRLRIETPVAGFYDKAPYAYQIIGSVQVEVSVSFAVRPTSEKGVFEYGFTVGAYDPTVPLVIDPATLIYCGYIGGTPSSADDDLCRDVTVDGSGCAYVTGWTSCTQTSFPVTVGPDLTHNGSGDVFVAKVSADGTGLIYCGYIGGSLTEQAWGIAVDPSGCAYVGGNTFSTPGHGFPVLVGPDLTHNGYLDAFVAKIDAAGTALLYCGYMGGTDQENIYDVAVDQHGNLYVTGHTFTSDGTFPIQNGPDLTYNGGIKDAFVARINAVTATLSYCGFIGGTDNEGGYGIAVDQNLYAYVTGVTGSNEVSFPVTTGPDLTYNGGGSDAFAAKVNLNGTALVYCGYIGGGDYDGGNGIAVDDLQQAHVGGFTASSQASFPEAVGPDLTYNGGEDCFVAGVNATGTGLQYCGYIGGSDAERINEVDVDPDRNVYVTGYTSSDEASFPVVDGPDVTYNGATDGFVAKVDAGGASLGYCGYIGGAALDHGWGIAVDAAGDAYAAGLTSSTQTSFPVTVGPDLTYNGGSQDIWVAKIRAACCIPPLRGNVDFDPGDNVNIVDLTFLVAYLFSSGPTPPCFEEGDMQADGNINIVDLTYITAYLFGSGPAPLACP